MKFCFLEQSRYLVIVDAFGKIILYIYVYSLKAFPYLSCLFSIRIS